MKKEKNHRIQTMQRMNKMRNSGISLYIKNLAAVLVVKFAFYLLVSILYVWLLVSLGFKNLFDWNLAFLISISLVIFSLLFEKPQQVQVINEK